MLHPRTTLRPRTTGTAPGPRQSIRFLFSSNVAVVKSCPACLTQCLSWKLFANIASHGKNLLVSILLKGAGQPNTGYTLEPLPVSAWMERAWSPKMMFLHGESQYESILGRPPEYGIHQRTRIIPVFAWTERAFSISLFGINISTKVFQPDQLTGQAPPTIDDIPILLRVCT